MKHTTISTEALNFSGKGLDELKKILESHEIKRVSVDHEDGKIGQIITFDIEERFTNSRED